jgi:RNA polymerase sigma factor (sigma-70 family)
MASVAPEIPVLVRDQAFEHLYRHYVKDVYHYALALLRNPADAEDVTQTTFLNAYRAWQRGQEIEKPRNWLIKIAHNVARTRYARSSCRVKEVPLDDHLDQLAVPEEERPNIEGVLRALGRLPFNQRAALVMRELEGRSYVEIADTIGVSVPAVETLIFRARKSLRMRASALRSLTAVPLPSSLAQLFGGGGTVVAGGGSLVGTGFLVKAAIALLTGAVVTGVVGTQSRPATVASDSVRPVRATAFTGHPVGVRAAVRTTVRRGIAPTARAVGATAHAVGSRPVTPPPDVGHGSTPSSPDLGLPAAELTKVAPILPSAVETVEKTVPAAATSVIAEVVSSLPAPPDLPSPPKLP